MPLDLKYRPTRFDQVIGNDGVIKLLKRRSIAKTLTNQSMIFGGSKGCGKTTLARIVSRAIYCDALNDGEPCNLCDSCLSILNETSSSFDEFDAAVHGTAEKIRLIVKDLEFVPIDGKPRVCILDEAHRLSKAAQDVLLRPIEDRRITVIFCTTDPDNVQDAIRSRMEEYPVIAPSNELLFGFLERICKSERIEFDSEALNSISVMTERCPRVCLNTIELLSSAGKLSKELVWEHFRMGSYDLVTKIISNLNFNKPNMIKYFDELSNAESPTWIKEKLVLAIVCAVRQNFGIKHNFPLPIVCNKFDYDYFSNVASKLSSIYHPNLYDIEAVLYHNVSRDLVQKTTVEVVTKPVEVNVSLDKKQKVITVDGVSFSSDEKLTTLDGKIEKPASVIKDKPVFQSKNDSRYVPISEKEFASSLLEGLKSFK